MGFLLIFVDGIGIGENDKEKNPFSAANSKYFKALLNQPDRFIETIPDGIIVPTDACLGMDGLPQSATGQTSLFTGRNAQKEVGRHVNAFPTISVRKILKSNNIMMELARMGKKVR